MRVKNMVVLFWLISSLANAEPPQLVPVTINSQPQGARLSDQYQNYLGLTGQPLTVDFAPGRGQLEIHLDLAGYEPRTFPLQPGQLNASHIYPELIVLSKKSSGLQTAFGWLAPSGLALGLLALGWRVRGGKASLQGAPGMAVMPDSGSLAGRVLGRYRLLERVGAGGMATVYRSLPGDARDSSEVVAIKVMRRELLNEPGMAERFRREIKLTAALDHPNIVRVADWGEEQGLAYLAMEWMGGGTLRELFKNDMVALEDVWDALSPLCSAVHHAHSRGVVHRDLKPENIMVTKAGVIKVTDFGLARAGEADRVTATGAVLGTPAYMAPEQIQGDPPSASMDQYSVGVIAFELLTGRLPFSEADAVQLIFKTISETPPPPSEFRQLSPQIDQVVLKMLAKRPQDRFAGLDLAAQALKGALLA